MIHKRWVLSGCREGERCQTNRSFVYETWAVFLYCAREAHLASKSISRSRCIITQYDLLSVVNYLMCLSGSVSMFFPRQLSTQQFTYKLNCISSYWVESGIIIGTVCYYSWQIETTNFPVDLFQITYFFRQLLGSEDCL